MPAPYGWLHDTSGTPPPPTTTTLHTLAVTNDGNLWHTARYASGSWDPFGNVKNNVSNGSTIGTITATATANINGSLNVLAVTNDGNIWATWRHSSDGTWDAFSNVKTATNSNPGFVITASVANVGGLANVLALTNDGNLWNAIRNASGYWTTFGNVNAATNSNPGTITAVAADGI